MDIAVVSDAGTPLVCDPGQRLIAAAIDHDIPIVAIPGASAVLAALAASGYAGDEFVFVGFAPSRSKDRKAWLERLSAEPRTVVFFESPHRIQQTMSEMAALLGDRPITVARELTKLHESVIRTTAAKLNEWEYPARGEFTIVLGPYTELIAAAEPIDDAALRSYFGQMTNPIGLSRRDAVAATASKFGLSPNEVYSRLERIKASGPS
jgi:16S rRNA (cytidine1402-2'-O)-methyltransferase